MENILYFGENKKAGIEFNKLAEELVHKTKELCEKQKSEELKAEKKLEKFMITH